MFRILRERMRQKYRTIKFPQDSLVPQGPYRGCPSINYSACNECGECVVSCPAQALDISKRTIDLGRCLFCAQCQTLCPKQAIEFNKNFRLATTNRTDLILTANQSLNLAKALPPEKQNLFARSLKLRQVSAGGCNGCELDVNVLNTLAFDLGRFGIQFVASPRHADGILVTGPVSKNMELALIKTYQAIPAPKIVIAVGACSISGGLFRTHPETTSGINDLLPVDLYVPGCPPHPLSILDGLLRLQGKISDSLATLT